MAEQIRNKKLSPIELVEAHLARIEELNPRLNAFVHVDSEGARRQARVAEAAVRPGAKLGVLHGVPLSIKSSMEVAGMPWEAGTRLRTGVVGERDAPLVARLRQAGAIILGVTNAPELLMAWETDNLLYGCTNNPWDLARTPGGSSGGEAAAIAAGISAGGVGRRRIDSRARPLQRNLRPEAHARTHPCNRTLPGLSRAFRAAGRGRTDGPQRG